MSDPLDAGSCVLVQELHRLQGLIQRLEARGEPLDVYLDACDAAGTSTSSSSRFFSVTPKISARAIAAVATAALACAGVAALLGLNSAGALWGHASHLAQFTSVLRNPVFVDGKNYSGAPHPVTTPFLFEQVRRWFAPEAARLRHALFVPLGPKVTEAVEAVADEAARADLLSV